MYGFLLRHHPAEWAEADLGDLAALDQAGALGAAAACVQLACRSHGAAGPTPAAAQLAGLLERCTAAGVLEVAHAARCGAPGVACLPSPAARAGVRLGPWSSCLLLCSTLI